MQENKNTLTLAGEVILLAIDSNCWGPVLEVMKAGKFVREEQ